MKFTLLSIEIDKYWPKFARDIKAYLDDLGCQYYLKDDLRKLL